MHIPDFSLGRSITEEQRAFFATHGFIRFAGVASRDEVRALLAALAALEKGGVRLLPGTHTEGFLPMCFRELSRRRDLYMPYVRGPYQPRAEGGPTPSYHRFQRLVG